MVHQSVLVREVLESFDLPKRRSIIDATLGLGGHSEAVFKCSDFSGVIFGIDQDERHLRFAEERLSVFAARFSAVQDNFGNLSEILDHAALRFDGILFDLGVASPHFDLADRGFSYQTEGPLDMRMDVRNPLTAATILQSLSAAELAKMFYDYGEETLAKPISDRIVQYRASKPLTTTRELKDLIVDVYRSAGWYSSKKNPATKVFQALRIAVNDEMRVLEKALRTSIDRIDPGGRIIVISYHSHEDRMVKQLFKSAENPCLCPPKLPVCACGRKPLLRILTSQAVIPSDEEVKSNSRARSAKMRVAERL